MLTYNMDVLPQSRWLRTTPGPATLAQPFYCTEAGLFYGRNLFSTARTGKDSYLLFYTVKGAGLVEQEGEQVLLPAGHGLLMDCRTPQSYCTAPGEDCWHHYWVHLDGSGVRAAAGLLQLPGIESVPVSDASMGSLFGQLLDSLPGDTTQNILEQGVLLHRMLGELAKGYLVREQDTGKRQTILRIAQEISANYRQELSIGAMLQQAHMSKSYFMRLFRQYIGTTPYNYLVNTRITHAKELLVMTDRSIGEIGREVGFGDISNFSTRFTAITGQSPLQYRKSLQNRP